MKAGRSYTSKDVTIRVAVTTPTFKYDLQRSQAEKGDQKRTASSAANNA